MNGRFSFYYHHDTTELKNGKLNSYGYITAKTILTPAREKRFAFREQVLFSLGYEPFVLKH